MKYLIANWKQNKNITEINNWLEYIALAITNKKTTVKNIQVVICPTFLHINHVKNKLELSVLNLFKIGAQNVSQFQDGAHTGEVGALQLNGFVDFVIIGHSERKVIGETLEQIGQKIVMAQKNNLIPVICFTSTHDYTQLKSYIDLGKKYLLAYEPIESIGSGNPASLENVVKIMENTGITELVYGGSVDGKSVKNYLSDGRIIGFLVGGASLKPSTFLEIVKSLN